MKALKIISVLIEIIAYMILIRIIGLPATIALVLLKIAHFIDEHLN